MLHVEMIVGCFIVSDFNVLLFDHKYNIYMCYLNMMFRYHEFFN